MVLKCGVIVQCSVMYEETNIRSIFAAPLFLGVGKPPCQKLRSRHLETAALILFMSFVVFVYCEWLGHCKLGPSVSAGGGCTAQVSTQFLYLCGWRFSGWRFSGWWLSGWWFSGWWFSGWRFSGWWFAGG